MMKRWVFILLLSSPCLVLAQDKYNILWITCEDISPNLGCYGDTVAVTPNIDRLASEGMLMTNAFATAGVCAPARSSIITGMYPASIGTHHMRTTWGTPFGRNYSAVIPPQVKTFTEHLRGAGYYCTNNFKTDYQFEAPFTAWDDNGTNAHWRNRPEGKPFFSVFNLEVTHESQIWKRESYALLIDPDSVNVPPYYPDTKEVREDIARNYSNIQVMDQQVGEILKQLEDDGLADNTIVFFYSDNGGPLPRQKREVHGSGIWVPMVIRFPDGTYQGVTNDELVNFADLAPTVLSLADVPIPNYIQGKAFLGKSKDTDPRKYSVASRDRLDEHYDMSRSVTDGRYIYVKNYNPDKPWYMPIAYRENIDMMQELLELRDQGALDEIQMRWFLESKPEEELYDLEHDPYEIYNLASDVNYQHNLEELRGALLDWQARYGDLGFVPEEEMLQSMWPNYLQPTTDNPKIIYNYSTDKVTITCPTEGASIGYKIGNEDNNWQVYTGSVDLPEGETIHAKAIRIGFKESGISNFIQSTNASIGRYTGSPLVMDGQLDSLWLSVPGNHLKNQLIGNTSTAGDLDATWKALWDERNLYIFVDVIDDVIYADSESTYHDDDAVEIYFDWNNSKTANYDGIDDYQYIFRYKDEAGEAYQLPPNGVENVSFKTIERAGGYRMELLFPFAAYGISPEEGVEIGFEIHVNDDDTGNSRDAKHGWNSVSDNAWSRTDVFGTVRLGDTISTVAMQSPSLQLSENKSFEEGDDINLTISGQQQFSKVRLFNQETVIREKEGAFPGEYVVSNLSPGSYALTAELITEQNQSIMASGTVTIEVAALIEPLIEIAQEEQAYQVGDALRLKAYLPSAGTAYEHIEWYKNDTLQVESVVSELPVYGQFLLDKPGVQLFHAVLRTASGKQRITNQVEISVKASVILSTNEAYDQQFRIFPNPAAGEVMIENGGQAGEYQVIVYSMYGQVVSSQNFSHRKMLKVNLGNTPGIYMVTIHGKSGLQMFRILNDKP